MKKYNLVVDVSLCNNCANCQLATMDEHIGNDFPGYAAPAPATGRPWITIERFERGSGIQIDVSYLPTMCNHCDNAPCGAGRDEAFAKRSDGLVAIVPEKAKGRKDLVRKCPVGAIHWNEELDLPQLWTFDAHLLDRGWTEPRAVHACPTRAMQVRHLTDAEMAERVEADGLLPLRVMRATKPRVYYKNLERVTHRRIAGTVIGFRGGQRECLIGAQVELKGPGTQVLSAETDDFGDFCFDKLEPADKSYMLRLTCEGYHPCEVPISISGPGVSLGEILLESARLP